MNSNKGLFLGLLIMGLMFLPACGGGGGSGGAPTTEETTNIEGLVFHVNKILGNELFFGEADGSGAVNLSGTTLNMESFRISPDKTRAAFIADIDTLGVLELYVVHLKDGISPVKVSGPMVDGGNVLDLKWSPDSTRIAYLADQETDETRELFTTFPDGTGNVKVNGPMVSGGTFKGGIWSPDSTRIAYSADQETDGITELFTTFPDGSGNVKVNDSLVSGAWVSYFSW